MGKRKRSNSVELQYLQKKLRKLEKKLKPSSNRGSVSRSPTPECEREPRSSPEVAEDRASMVKSPMREDDIMVNQPEAIENSDKNEAEPELDTSILELLGNDPSSDNKYGDSLHKDIILRWKHILTHGLDKEQNTELKKQYLPPENCSNLRAPKLNLEIKAALSEINLRKETFNEMKQNQLSSCLAALGKALNLALCPNEEETSMKDLIKPLSDAGRLLCDYHHRESQARRYAIINVLNKDIRDTVRNTKIDEYLFGADLGEQLKSAKAITKSGSELKPSRPPYKAPASGSQREALNSRGARGAASTTRPLAQRRPPAPPATATRDRDRDHYRHDASSSTRRSSQRGRTRRR